MHAMYPLLRSWATVLSQYRKPIQPLNKSHSTTERFYHDAFPTNEIDIEYSCPPSAFGNDPECEGRVLLTELQGLRCLVVWLIRELLRKLLGRQLYLVGGRSRFWQL
jgi:hypothetical protein